MGDCRRTSEELQVGMGEREVEVADTDVDGEVHADVLKAGSSCRPSSCAVATGE